VECAPDLYLDEMQEMLAMHYGQEVSRSTIWRALSKSGMTMKKVAYMYINQLRLTGHDL
jgi:transposase